MKRPLSSRERQILSLAAVAGLVLAAGLLVGRLDAKPGATGAAADCAEASGAAGHAATGPCADHPPTAADGAPGGPAAPTLGLVTAPTEGGPVRFTARLDRSAVLAGEPGEVRMQLALAAAAGGAGVRRPTDFYVVLDRSGSMEGEKIEHARAAVEHLVDQLGIDDRFALVSYASEARVDVPLEPMVLATRAEWGASRWKRAVARIEAGGGTAMSLGLDLALEQAGARRPEGRAARLLLLSDGLANEGDFSPEGLAARARRAAAASLTVSTIGVGEDFNEVLMTDLADVGLGNYYYLPGAEQIAGVLAAELQATRETVAEEVEVALAPGPGVRVREVAGYPFAQRGDRVVFSPGALFAGQERRVWVTLETPAGGGAAAGHALRLATVEASYTSEGRRRVAALPAPLRVALVATPAEALAAIDREAWECAVVEEEYGKLQEEVAASVRAGKREDALRSIATYAERQRATNAVVQSAAVAENLAGLAALEADVEDAFTGADQAGKQNQLAKARQATGYDARRQGAKRLPGPVPVATPVPSPAP